MTWSSCLLVVRVPWEWWQLFQSSLRPNLNQSMWLTWAVLTLSRSRGSTQQPKGCWGRSCQVCISLYHWYLAWSQLYQSMIFLRCTLVLLSWKININELWSNARSAHKSGPPRDLKLLYSLLWSVNFTPAVEVLDSYCQRVVETHCHLPNPIKPAPFYTLVETSGSNDEHDNEVSCIFMLVFTCIPNINDVHGSL